MKLLAICLLLLPVFSATAVTTVKLNELFSPEKNSGAGILTFTQNEKTEKLEFGVGKSLYALGMLFEGSTLPSPYAESFKDKQILQVVLGTLRQNIQFQVPQFSAATFVFKTGAKMPLSFSFEKMTAEPRKDFPLAFLLFTSPSTPNNQSDEGKLKGTFFSQSGSVTLMTKGKSSTIEAKYNGKPVSFKTQTMTAELKTSLTTPFNAEENSLKGRIEFPVYSPHGKEAQELAKKIAAESMVSLSPPPFSEGLSQHNRNVAGSSKEPRNKEETSSTEP